jgi:hypothetical protein
VQRDDFSLPDGGSAGVQVDCPAGTKIVGGGSSTAASSSTDIHQTVSRPFRLTPGADGTEPVNGETFDAWRVTYVNPPSGTGPTTVSAYAICAET